MLMAADYRPAHWLRNPHLQSLLGTSPMRRWRGQAAMAACGAVTTEHLVDGGHGVRLLGLHSVVSDIAPRGLVLLLHGWEGSADSSYMRLTAARLLAAGFEVFRLNFRDHGQTHHLNEAIFHSNRIDEVVNAALDVARMFPRHPFLAAGYSLGANFALRLALRAPAAGLPLVHVAAVCPVLDPARTMTMMESGLGLYHDHFARKWRQSLQRKRALFPEQHDFDDRTLRQGLRELTRALVERQTEFESLDAYFDGYNIAGERLARLQVPASVLTSHDDPVIPVADFKALSLPVDAHLDIARWGGHCGFIRNARLDGFAEDWVAARLVAAADGSLPRRQA